MNLIAELPINDDRAFNDDGQGQHRQEEQKVNHPASAGAGQKLQER